MEIKKFLANLVPTMERSNLRNALESVQQELSRHNAPNFANAAKQLGGLKFESEWAYNYDALVAKASKIKVRGNTIAMIDAINKTLPDIFDKISVLIDDYFNEDFSNESITAPRYNLIQFIEALSFYVDYSARWFHMATIKELSLRNGEDENTNVVPIELEWLNLNKGAFIAVVNIITHNGGHIDEVIEKLDDVIITKDSAGMLAKTVGDNKIDPMGFGFISTRLSPLFYARMAYYKYQAQRLKTYQARSEAMQLRIIALRTTIDGKPDAAKLALAKRLEENRLVPMMQKIAELEDLAND